MGWSFALSTSHGKKECVAQLRNPGRFSMGTQILKSCVSGNRHWYLAQTDGVTWIGLDLLQGGGKRMGWGYKSLDESAGPYYYDCPLSYLDAASEPKGHAAEWRQKVRAYWAAKAARIKPYASQVVSYGGHQYLLMSPAGPRKGWHVNRVSDGAALRMSARQLANATTINTEIAA